MQNYMQIYLKQEWKYVERHTLSNKTGGQTNYRALSFKESEYYLSQLIAYKNVFFYIKIYYKNLKIK